MVYFVATPIGNMLDMSYRAVETLKSVDIIACEDTRHSLKLLDYYGIKKQLISYHKFNESKSAEYICELVKGGKSVAVISDAGMPVISDPGNILVKVLIENGLQYSVIPGASACLSALLLSGLDSARFTFIGFLPEKSKEKLELLNEYKNSKSTLIFYSAPHDINNYIKDLYSVFGSRNACAVKEITKMHETVYRFNLEDGKIDEPKGEFVLLVEGAKNEEAGYSESQIIELLNNYILDGLSKKDAIKKVCETLNVSKNEVYKYSLKIK